jgi:glycosyltransferase involved in cell wall biosynthesis
MRICFIAHGQFTHIDAYIDYFKEHGHDVHFVSLAPGPQRTVPTYNVGFKTGGKWSYLPAILRARGVTRSLKPDIVHAHYATSGGLAAYASGVRPFLVTAHGTDVLQGVKSAVWRPILRQIFRSSECVNPVSDELRELVLKLGIPHQKVETLTLGIDTNRFGFQTSCARDPSAPIRLICTRRLERVYDHATIIKSMALLKKRGADFELTLLGDGSLRRSLEMICAELGVGSQVFFAGGIPNATLPAYLAKHDIYLSASTHDGTSLSLLEAMSSGLYPVVSDIKANAAWIRHGENGLLHRVSDPQSLAECIGLFPRKSGRVIDVLRHNRDLIVKLGDRSTNMQRIGEIYQHLHQARAQLNGVSTGNFIFL